MTRTPRRTSQSRRSKRWFSAGTARFRGSKPRRSRLLFAAFPLARHFLAFLARFRQADRDRLLLARHFLPAASALERSPFALVHRALHLLGSALRIFPGHCGSSGN